MTFSRLISMGRQFKLGKICRILLLSAIAFLLIFGGNLACKKEAAAIAEEKEEEEGAVGLEEGIITFEGVVKLAVGKYVFIPKVQGFDIVVQGTLESDDIQTLIDKEVRGDGEFSSENPSLLLANTIEAKEPEGEWISVFKRSEEFVTDDYLDLHERDKFEILKDISYDKKKDWEEKEKVKIYGRLEKETITEGEEEKEIYRISVLDDEGKEIGKILVDSFTDFAQFYIKKLRLIDKFWFYISIKDTVDWKIRRRTRELFHADVLFAGLY